MITLLTGLPGNGKTYYLVKTLTELIKKEGQQRRYFQNGITDFSVPGVETFEPEKWYELPDKSFFVIDEAQRIFPTAQPGGPIGKKLSEFETHRHRGMDCIIITQDASLIHHHLRRLVGEHINVERPFGMPFANVLTFQGLKNPKDYHDRQTATKSVMRFSPEVFNQYRSATHHTVKTRIPFKLILLPILLCVFVAAGYAAYTGLRSQQRTVGADGKPVQSTGVPGMYPTGMEPKGQSAKALTPVEYAKQWEPRINQVPWSAPRYDELTKPQDFPRVAACVQLAGRCNCWTQQATAIKVSDSICKTFVASGEFDDKLASSNKLASNALDPQQPSKDTQGSPLGPKR